MPLPGCARALERGFLSARLVAWAQALLLGAGLSSSGCGLDDRELGLVAPDAGARLGTLCEAPGCEALPLQPCGPECPEVPCPADDACRDYEDLLSQGTCSAETCATVADCPFTWKPAAREGEACTCDGAGCELLEGEPCTRPEVCASDSCVATDGGGSICCAAACGPAEVCAPDGSACLPAAPCGEDERRCSGATHQQCADGVWTLLSDCGALGCDSSRGGCLRSAGQSCESDADCGEGTCLATIEGNFVCCAGDCDATCRRCAASGTACVNLEDDAACGTIECPEDACRSYDPPTVATDRCREGRCATLAEACTVFEPRRANLECSPSALCDEEGGCSRPKQQLLAACSSDAECGSGACVATAAGDSVCCAVTCAPSEVCSATGGCEPAPVCEDGAAQCSGASFQRCSGGQWTTLAECGALGCSVAREGCLSGAGDTCSSDLDCGVGRCQPTASGGSVCCTAVCDGPCRRCAPTGTACEALPDDAACGAIACPADTTCRDFPASVTSNRCVAGRCGSANQLCGGTPRASGQVCSATSLCDDAGNCSAPKRAVGTPCTSNAECASNSCADGVCCNQACSGVCATCAGTGICRGTATDASCPTVSCSRFDESCVESTTNTAGVCAGRGQCRTEADCGFRPSLTQCEQGGSCDGQGFCSSPTVACAGTTCQTGDGALCCSEFDGTDSSLRCVNGSTCPAPPAFVPSIPISCDQHIDCPGEQVCCHSGTSTSSQLSCVTNCSTPNPMLFAQQLCESPAGRIFLQCPAGQTCDFSTDRLPGFAFCR